MRPRNVSTEGGQSGEAWVLDTYLGLKVCVRMAAGVGSVGVLDDDEPDTDLLELR